MIVITSFVNAVHRSQVIALWRATFGYQAAHHNPSLVIDKKLAVDDHFFFVAIDEDVVVGTTIAGYDGHRGWIYSVAVSPSHQRQGIGSRLVRHAEQALTSNGCVKINLQIIEGNERAIRFYASLGYSSQKLISTGKLVPANLSVATENSPKIG